MNLQFLADGLVAGSMIALGAIGVTLTYSILRFSNFAHGEMVSWGGYIALTVAGWIGTLAAHAAEPLEPLSIGWNVVAAALVAMVLTGLLAWALDALLYAPLRRSGTAISLVMASFGASMALRALLEVVYSTKPAYFSRELQIAIPVGMGVRVTPDQIGLLVTTAVLVGALHLFLRHTSTGRAMRAVSESPQLARVVGIDVARVIRVTWFIGGGLACAAGVLLGLIVQIRPGMGFDLLLPLFAAAILGGIGSVPGALAGGLIVGLSEAAAVELVGAQWRAAVAFVVLIGVLIVRPAGLAGRST
jgi:branched-chain amino acid transport system permease protein